MVDEEKVKTVVRETLLSLGVDPTNTIETQKQMQSLRALSNMLCDKDFQRDLLFLRKWRKSMERASNISTRTVIKTIVIFFFGMLVFVFKMWIGHETHH